MCFGDINWKAMLHKVGTVANISLPHNWAPMTGKFYGNKHLSFLFEKFDRDMIVQLLEHP